MDAEEFYMRNYTMYGVWNEDDSRESEDNNEEE